MIAEWEDEKTFLKAREHKRAGRVLWAKIQEENNVKMEKIPKYVKIMGRVKSNEKQEEVSGLNIRVIRKQQEDGK